MKKSIVIQREKGWLEREATKAKEDIASWPSWIRSSARLAGGNIVETSHGKNTCKKIKLMQAKKLELA